MPRYLPSLPYTCPICGAAFALSNRFEPARPGVVHTPDACPACDAPIRTVLPIDVGAAKDLVLACYGGRGGASGFLVRRCLGEADVERCVALALALDMAAWPAADVREQAAIRRASAAQASGALARTLRRAADRARAAIRSRREHHLAVWAARRGEA